MKRKRKILFRIVYLIAVLLCSGINGYSDFNILPNNSELISGIDSEENNSISDVDFFDDQQINPTLEFKAVIDLKYQIPIQKCNLIFRYYTSIWQPPQNK